MSSFDTALAHGTIGITMRDTTVPAIVGNTKREQPRTKWCHIGSRDSGIAMSSCSMFMNMNKFFGRKVLADGEFKGSASQNPNEDAIFEVWFQAFSAISDPSEVAFQATLTFYAVWHEPKHILGS